MKTALQELIELLAEMLVKFANQSNQQSEVDHVKDFHTWRLPNEKELNQNK